MKSYENNMADQDVIVHSIRVLSEIKNPALTQLKREVSTVQKSANQIAQRNDKYWQELSTDNIITPIEKKIIQREMENIANSYTALYTQAVAEHYDTADFFVDYMATYNALRDYVYTTLQLFNNMESNTDVDREEFNEYFSDYYYSENFAIVSMTVGVISQMGFKILMSLEDEGEEGEVGLYHGALYQYIDGNWKLINRELYFGKSAVLPPSTDGRYFLCTINGLLDDALFLNDELAEINGDQLNLFTDYYKGFIYVYEDLHWEQKDPEDDYRYIVAMGDYYSEVETFPAIFKNEVEIIAEDAVRRTYQGPAYVPPEDPREGDFFLYLGATSLDQHWIQYELYIYRNSEWTRIKEADFGNRDYFMQALSDILTYAPSTTGYFSKAFCDSFFANQASLNALSTRVIFLDTGGMIKSNVYTAETTGLKIDAAGNIDANQNTHIGGKCAIGVSLNDMGNYDVVIGGNAKIGGTLDGADGTFTGTLNGGTLNGATGNFTGEVNATSGTLSNLKVKGSFAFEGSNDVWGEIKGAVSVGDLIYLRKCFCIGTSNSVGNFGYIDDIDDLMYAWEDFVGPLNGTSIPVYARTADFYSKCTGFVQIRANNQDYYLMLFEKRYIRKSGNIFRTNVAQFYAIDLSTWKIYFIHIDYSQDPKVVKLYEIARGMSIYNANAKTEIGDITFFAGIISLKI